MRMTISVGDIGFLRDPIDRARAQGRIESLAQLSDEQVRDRFT